MPGSSGGGGVAATSGTVQMSPEYGGGGVAGASKVGRASADGDSAEASGWADAFEVGGWSGVGGPRVMSTGGGLLRVFRSSGDGGEFTLQAKLVQITI